MLLELYNRYAMGVVFIEAHRDRGAAVSASGGYCLREMYVTERELVKPFSKFAYVYAVYTSNDNVLLPRIASDHCGMCCHDDRK